MPGRSSRPDTTSPLFGETPAPTISQSGAKLTITAHCDGGARGNPGPAGFGVEVTNATGDVLAELSEFLGICTNNVAEYSGLLASLDYALEYGYRRLRVISDSELMVKQIQGKYKVNSPDLKTLWLKAKERIAKLEFFEITHALRHKNKAADRLANEAMDRGMRRGATPENRQAQHRGASTSDADSPGALPYPHANSAPPSPARLDSSKRDATTGGESTATPPRAAGSEVTAPMLRCFTRGGVIHLLGGRTLPDGLFVKVIPE